MPLINITSPHLTRRGSTGHVMTLVIMATVPAITMLTYYFGWGNLINIIWATVVALVCEVLVAKLRGRPLSTYLFDGSAALTAVLIGLSLPPLAPWWLTLIAVTFAILVAKQLYGGLGQNPFNPAMIGYALVLISFPVEMTSWLAPKVLAAETGSVLSFRETLFSIFPFLNAATVVDAVTMATPLDAFKHKGAITGEEFWSSNVAMSPEIWIAWQFTGLAYLLGGIYLIYRRVFTWHAPVAMLLTLLVLSTAFWSYDPSNFASPELHMLAGATIFGAFFIVTDPVTSATSVKGRLYYGAGIGALLFVIRTWGNYPDAVAFAVLLMNFAAPLIDHYTQPRTYGHKSGGGS